MISLLLFAIENALDDACSAPGNDDGIMGDSEGI